MKSNWTLAGVFLGGLLLGAVFFAMGFDRTYKAPPEETAAEEPMPEKEPVLQTENEVTEDAVVVYQYYYEADGEVVEQETEASYFMIGLDRFALESSYPDWEILSFSPEKVVMRRTIGEEEEKSYIIGTYEGRLAVFCEDERKGSSLYELTDIVVAALSGEEQLRLNDGIVVSGEAELAKVLESYGS